MKFIIISAPCHVHKEASLINQFLANGLESFHLRKHSWDSNQLESLIIQINHEHRNKIVIHNHFHLADKYELKGIHLPSKIRSIKNTMANYPIPKSTSCHSFHEVKALEKDSFECTFLSPIFNSISKPDYTAQFSNKEIENFLSKPRKTQVIALGGINKNNMLECEKMGFDGVAILGAIWNSHNPLEAFREIRNIIFPWGNERKY